MCNASLRRGSLKRASYVFEQSTVTSTNFQHSFRKWTLAVEEGVCGSEIYAKVEMSPLITTLQPSMPPITLKHTISKAHILKRSHS